MYSLAQHLNIKKSKKMNLYFCQNIKIKINLHGKLIEVIVVLKNLDLLKSFSVFISKNNQTNKHKIKIWHKGYFNQSLIYVFRLTKKFSSETYSYKYMKIVLQKIPKIKPIKRYKGY